MVEILRPAQRHFVGQETETFRAIPPGAPSAAFLAQLLTYDEANAPTSADVADRYEAAAALTGEPYRLCVATL